MTLHPEIIADRTVPVTLDRWPRIFDASHAATPVGAGFGSSRFSSPRKLFRTLYAGETFAVAFAESVVRDRFVGRRRRFLYRPTLEALVVTEVSTSAPLDLLDFTGDTAYDLGIDTDAKGARSHLAGQEFAEALHGETSLDGILYESRITGVHCVALFNRGFGKLAGTVPVDLLAVAALEDELRQRKISLRRGRAV